MRACLCVQHYQMEACTQHGGKDSVHLIEHGVLQRLLTELVATCALLSHKSRQVSSQKLARYA